MYLGLDLGTSGIKGVVIDDAQQLVAEARAPLTVARPHPGWSEQSPAEWLSATSDVMAALGSQIDMSAVKAIGLSGQMHGATLIDAKGDVLRPCILWNDTRSHAEAARMDADPQFRHVSGNIVFPGFTAPKLAWVKNNETNVFAATDKVLLPKDYLRLWLTGVAVSEMSDAAGTSWLDVGARDWSDDLLAATGLERAHMPSLVEGSAVSGTLRPELASNWGLPAGIPVAGGGGDNAATAIGVGVTKPGQAFLSLGTSGVIFAATERYAPAPDTAVHTFCHALPDTWHQMGVILSAADALEWYGRLVRQTPAALTGALEGVAAPGRALFLPYLGGERTPHNDARIRGALIGLQNETDTAAGTRAVLEGVSFALKDNLDALAATGTQINNLIAVGGGSASRVWLRTLATCLGVPIAVPVSGDFGAAFGAARLGMMAVSNDLTIATPPKIAETLEPEAQHKDAFAEAHIRYRSTYSALRTLS
ncbi:xylulokinase [Litoreibacter roseus]|uniref:Xylulose kinase n=1 Tax=Litoreibacter roseus TaxID=2601869 RepID=A0A6N6JJK8_9RHOB|nr:xylulokinase [Litoreibacter roseus]GFE66137.1 xylulokinase [Litoreibacter roseus]